MFKFQNYWHGVNKDKDQRNFIESVLNRNIIIFTFAKYEKKILYIWLHLSSSHILTYPKQWYTTCMP